MSHNLIQLFELEVAALTSERMTALSITVPSCVKVRFIASSRQEIIEIRPLASATSITCCQLLISCKMSPFMQIRLPKFPVSVLTIQIDLLLIPTAKKLQLAKAISQTYCYGSVKTFIFTSKIVGHTSYEIAPVLNQFDYASGVKRTVSRAFLVVNPVKRLPNRDGLFYFSYQGIEV